ncbi:MAG: B12-binding domain-containing radical SAM protein [Candidatus Omnitrophica bacterium]|nr:B12-binding domain-containing radical SAM protein [Candidatus Omnitrophota bacterium]
MAEIILVQLPTTYTDIFQDKPTIPLGLLSICRHIHQDYNIKILDLRYEHRWKERLSCEIDQHTICVGISCMTGRHIIKGIEVSKFIKQNFRTPIVWGGPHASILPQQTLQNPYIDFVVQGEGEVAFAELVKALEKQSDFTKIEGLWWKDNEIISGCNMGKSLDLDEFPPIPWHLVNMEDYIQSFQETRSITIETSRGCPHRCAFCCTPVLQKSRWRGLSPEPTVEMIKRLMEDYQIKTFIFNDDNFFADIKRARDIALQIISNKLNIRWYPRGVCVEALKNVEDNFISLLIESGCIKIKMGIESGSERIRKLVNKKDSIEEILELNRRLARFKLPGVYNFMCGFPSETTEDLKKTVGLLFKLLDENPYAQNAAFLIYTPYPGTELFNYSLKYNFREPSRLEEWIDFNIDNIASKSWLTKNQKRIVEGLYLSSIFLTDRIRDFVGFRKFTFINLLRKAYSIIAKFRVKNLYFRFLFESKIKKVLEGYINKKRLKNEIVAH